MDRPRIFSTKFSSLNMGIKLWMNGDDVDECWWMGINGDEWLVRGYYSPPFIPIPHSSNNESNVSMLKWHQGFSWILVNVSSQVETRRAVYMECKMSLVRALHMVHSVRDAAHLVSFMVCTCCASHTKCAAGVHTECTQQWRFALVKGFLVSTLSRIFYEMSKNF